MTLRPDTLCNLCRVRLAECELEVELGSVDFEPLCIAGGCADRTLERLVFSDEYPEHGGKLVPLRELVREELEAIA